MRHEGSFIVTRSLQSAGWDPMCIEEIDQPTCAADGYGKQKRSSGIYAEEGVRIRNLELASVTCGRISACFEVPD